MYRYYYYDQSYNIQQTCKYFAHDCSDIHNGNRGWDISGYIACKNISGFGCIGVTVVISL